MARRLTVCAFLALLIASPPLSAHRLEPISTQFARPFAPGHGNLQLTYDYAFFRPEDLRIHLIPDSEFEIGLTSRTQISVGWPLILERLPGEPARVGGGNPEFAFRYLFAGGPFNSYAISVNPFVAPPAGDTRLAGEATETGIAIHVDKDFGERALFHGNYGWSTTIGGTRERERTFFYRSAIVVPVSFHWNPTIELLGQTDTATGRTELALQPEVICHWSDHWELKLGVPLGLTHSAPNVGVRAQVVWIFGRGGSD